ncbi:MAG: class I SAM-dependent methyltransferase [Acidimicrobiales bacterium]
MAEERLDTAHEFWDQWWGDAKSRPMWSDPEPSVTRFMTALEQRGAKTVLDVGSGIGRHSLAYAANGFEVIAVDASSTGLEEVARSAQDRGLVIETRPGVFTSLPVDDASVDHVLAWNVIYHGDGDVVATALTECRRVLRVEGTLQVTFLSKRNKAYGVGEEIRPDTFVDKSSAGDKDHPHFYLDASGVTRMLSDAGFETLSLIDLEQHSPGAFHWAVLAERA